MVCTATVSGRGTTPVDASARGGDFQLATSGDNRLATNGDIDVATREDFFMAMDIFGREGADLVLSELLELLLRLPHVDDTKT